MLFGADENFDKQLQRRGAKNRHRHTYEEI
jgi:hypothetical protein